MKWGRVEVCNQYQCAEHASSRRYKRTRLHDGMPKLGLKIPLDCLQSNAPEQSAALANRNGGEPHEAQAPVECEHLPCSVQPTCAVSKSWYPRDMASLSESRRIIPAQPKPMSGSSTPFASATAVLLLASAPATDGIVHSDTGGANPLGHAIPPGGASAGVGARVHAVTMARRPVPRALLPSAPCTMFALRESERRGVSDS